MPGLRPRHICLTGWCPRVMLGGWTCPFHAKQIFKEIEMRPLYRKPVSKSRSASKFRHQTGRTKNINLKAGPMRGGIRL